MVECLTFFFVGIIKLQFLTGRAAIGILRWQIDEVLLAEAAFRLRARRHRFGERHSDAGLLAGQDLLAIEVAAISDRNELFRVQRRLCILRHARKL
jgi:hypothetical protein